MTVVTEVQAAEAGSLTPGERIARRYDGAAPAETGPWSETLDVLLGHHTARAYLPLPLPDGTLETIVAAAQSAPSSSNLQSWSVVAVSDPSRKARLADLAGPNKQIVEAPLFLVWIADLARSREIAVRACVPGDGLDYLESFLLAAIDTGLAAQNAVAAADSLGLGSCYVGAIRNNPLAVAEELGLPPETVAVFGLTVGYPDPARASEVKPRLPQSSILHIERYGEPAPDQDLANYNIALKRFQQKQSMPQTDWTQLVANRVGTTPALKGRDKLTDTLRQLGFKLL